MTTRRNVLAVLALLLLGTAAACQAQPDAGPQDDAREDPVERIAGPDRFATAGELAAHADGDTLWVATGRKFPDALAAAATGAGPVMLVDGDSVPAHTLDAANDLEGIDKVRAVGGGAVVGDDAVASVADAAGVEHVDRVSGAGRFDTAAAVARTTHPNGADTAYLATGQDYPDALAASAAAAERDAPVLLVTRDRVPEATLQELERLDVGGVVVVGGESVVGRAVLDELDRRHGIHERVAGRDRFETAVSVSRHRDLDAAGGADDAFVATGEDFPDVLAAAPAAISADAGLLLTGSDALPEATRDELGRLGPEQVTIAGGQAAVSTSVADEIRHLLDVESPPEGQVTVEFFDAGQADAALVRTEDAAILVDAGHWQRDDVVDHLADAGVTDELDVLSLTHWHADHIGQVPQVVDAFDVDEVWVQPGEHDSATYDDAVTAIEHSDATVRQPRQGETHTVEDLTVDIVGPSEAADAGDRHDATLALRVESADAGVLFTGDAESDTEARYVDRVPDLLDAQLYQVGHHGSATSTSRSLLDVADPDHAVYSAGSDNQHGHPHAEALDRLDAADADVFGTDVNGTVTATSDGSASWTVVPERTGEPRAGDENGDEDGDSTGCVDVNREDDLDELQRIVHIGEQRAGQLVNERPYDTLDDLARINGIGSSRVQDIKDQGLAAVEC